MSTGAIVGIVVGGVVGILLIAIIAWIWATYNKFIRMRNDCDEAFSTMDVYLKKRYDLIPNLVETVKGYAKHENKTLEAVIQARNMAMNSKSAEEQIKNENILSGTLKSLFAVSENYPELKADKHFTEMMNSLRQIEEEITSSRKYYNAVVKEYNVKREVFPSSIIAGWFKFVKKPLYEIEDVEQRKNVKVQF